MVDFYFSQICKIFRLNNENLQFPPKKSIINDNNERIHLFNWLLLVQNLNIHLIVLWTNNQTAESWKVVVTF